MSDPLDGSRSFQLPEAERALLESIRDLSVRLLVPIASEGAPGRVNRALVKALGSNGLFSHALPESGEPRALALCVVREALATESSEAETTWALQGLGSNPIVQAGSQVAADRWIPPLRAGDAVAAFALTEPDHGSDAASLELEARPDGDGFRLTGVKTFISNAPEADVYTVFGRTKAGAGARGITAFAVPGDARGLSGEPIEMMSPHPIGSLVFEDVLVPRDHVLGEVDGGFRVAMRTLDLFRPSVGAFAVGMAAAALEAARSHAGERRAFDRPIRDFQAVSHQLAEMATRTEAARLLVYAAASTYDAGERPTSRSAMAKLFATETAQFVIDAAIQIHGAKALTEDHRLSHLYRDVRATRIYEGTSEIQREIIARELFREGDR